MTKPTKLHHTVRPAKTQISLGIRPVWSESSLSAWRELAWVLSYPLSAKGRLWPDWADAQADLSLRWAHMPLYWFCHEMAQMWSNNENRAWSFFSLSLSLFFRLLTTCLQFIATNSSNCIYSGTLKTPPTRNTPDSSYTWILFIIFAEYVTTAAAYIDLLYVGGPGSNSRPLDWSCS